MRAAAIAARPLAEGLRRLVEAERQIYGLNAGTLAGVARSRLETIRPKEINVNDNKNDGTAKVPPPVFSAPPEKELEEKLKEHPHDCEAKVDVGSDESMDASDPPATSRPGSDEPAPSSGYPDK